MIDLEKNKSFCPYMFKGALIQGEGNKGHVTPCCRYDWKYSNPNRRANIKDSYTSYWREERKKMVKGQPVEGCWKCIEQESDGNHSMRTKALKSYKFNINDHDGFRGPYGLIDDILTKRLEYLEIETGRYCNLKCRSCGPSLSSSWDEDVKNNEQVIENFFSGNKDKMDSIYSAPNINETIANMNYDECKYLKELKVTGGEPFLSEPFLQFLSNLVDWDLAKNIKMEIFTNSSFFPKEKFRKLLPEFKSTFINLSLDGIGSKAEFLRKKSKWSIVEKVSKFWEEMVLENKNVYLCISHTLTIFNVLYYKEFHTWVHSHFDKKVFDPANHNVAGDMIHFGVASGPDYLAIRNFSKPIRDKLLEKVKKDHRELENYISTVEQNRLTSYASVRSNYGRIIRTLQGSKEVINTSHKKTVDDIFLQKTKMFDEIRQENWKEVFPELAEVFNE